MQTVNYRKGLGAMSVCFFIWGFQPLYWYMCTNVCGEIDTFFIMACRIIWAAVACLCILKVQGKLPQLWAVFKDKQVLKREMPASVLLFGDWLVYLWAVQNGRVLECSLGYYIQPLVVFALGAVIFREKMNWRHFVIIAIVVVGIVCSTSGFGGVPYVTIALALMFSIYAAIKKSLTIDSIVSTTSEILMMVPVALLFILFFRMGDNGMGSMTVVKQLLMIGGGVITGLPMVFYSIGVKHLPLMTTGICQYISPSLSIICGAIMGEALTREKLVSFLFIWTGVIPEQVVLPREVYEERKENYIERIEAMIAYIENDETCRSRQLMAYFGEENKNDCHRCDVCADHYGRVTKQQEKTARELILQQLADGEPHHITILRDLQIPKKQFEQVLSELVSEEIILVNGCQICLNKD